MSWRAILSSRSEVFAWASSGRSSIESGGTISSAKTIVSIISTSPGAGRIATSCSFERSTTRAIERVELLGREHHVAVARELVALHDVVVGDLVAGHRVHALLLDPVPGVLVQLVEADGLARDGRVQLDRHVDQ